MHAMAQWLRTVPPLTPLSRTTKRCDAPVNI
jgi:hypothetical protein